MPLRLFSLLLLWVLFSMTLQGAENELNDSLKGRENQEGALKKVHNGVNGVRDEAGLVMALPVAIPDEPLGEAGVLPEKNEQEENKNGGRISVSGLISDSATGAALEGVGVGVEGTDFWTSTDATGRYSLRGVPAGVCILSFNKLGFHGRVKEVEVKAVGVVNVQMMLDPKRDSGEDEYTMDDYDVVADYEEEDPTAIMLGAAEGGAIGSGLGKEEFAASGISDAAEAVGKISGANIVGGKYAVIRGLGDRYSNTTVNGALISSADPSRKAIQLDLFPSHLLQNVTVYKTFTPNLTAEFAGGLVALETLKFPEERILEVKFGLEGDTNTTGSDFYANPDGSLGFFGDRQDGLPPEVGPSFSDFSAGNTGRRTPRPGDARAAEGAADWGALHASGGMRPKKTNADLSQSLSLTYGDTFELGGDSKLGAVFAFTRSSKDKALEDVFIGRGPNPGADNIQGTGDDFLNRTQFENQYTRSVEYGFLGALTYQLNDRHTIGMTYFKNHVAEDKVTQGRRVDEPDGLFGQYQRAADSAWGAGSYTYRAFDQIEPLYRDLDIFQLEGTHYLGERERSTRINWLLSRTRAEEDRPQSRTLYFTEHDFADPRIASERGDIYDPSLGTVLTLPDIYENNPPLVRSFRESLNTLEKSFNGKFDVTVPFYFEDEGDDRFEIGMGFNRFKRDRTVRGRLFTYQIGNILNGRLIRGDGGQDGVDYLDGFDSLFEPDGTPKFDGWSGFPRRSDKLIISEDSTSGRTVRNVDAFTDLTAFYLMPSYHRGPWTITGGVRMEKETRGYQILPGLNPAAFVNDEVQEDENDYLFPALTVQYRFGQEDEHLISASWSRTIARPTFYEFAPVRTEDQSTGQVVEGNPALEDTLIDNYDLRWDWVIGERELLSLNFFYKTMDSPIAETIQGLGRKSWTNGETGTLQGVEIEFAKEIAENWSITANYTFIDSLLQYEQSLGTSGSQIIDSSFEGQPEHIFNLNLGYSNEEHGYSLNLVYNFTGSYLTAVPADNSSPAVVRNARESLDFIARKNVRLFGSDAIVTLEIGNLLDAPIEFQYEGAGFYESYHPGRSYKLSMKFSF